MTEGLIKLPRFKWIVWTCCRSSWTGGSPGAAKGPARGLEPVDAVRRRLGRGPWDGVPGAQDPPTVHGAAGVHVVGLLADRAGAVEAGVRPARRGLVRGQRRRPQPESEPKVLARARPRLRGAAGLDDRQRTRCGGRRRDPDEGQEESSQDARRRCGHVCRLLPSRSSHWDPQVGLSMIFIMIFY